MVVLTKITRDLVLESLKSCYPGFRWEKGLIVFAISGSSNQLFMSWEKEFFQKLRCEIEDNQIIFTFSEYYTPKTAEQLTQKIIKDLNQHSSFENGKLTIQYRFGVSDSISNEFLSAHLSLFLTMIIETIRLLGSNQERV